MLSIKTKYTFLSIFKNKLIFASVFLSLNVFFIIIFFTTQFSLFEFSFDKFHSDFEKIARVTINKTGQDEASNDARLPIKYQDELLAFSPKEDFITILCPFKKATIAINENIFFSDKVFSVDSNFFNVFNYELIIGDKSSCFKDLNKVVLTKTMALKYFGSIDVIGKEIKIKHQQWRAPLNYIVEGILNDFPKNSHISADILCTTSKQQTNFLAYAYVKIKSYNKLKDYEAFIQNKFQELNKEAEFSEVVTLQQISDIHLKSNKSREINKNGSLKSYLLIIAGALFVLIICLLNIVNLSYIDTIKENRFFNFNLLLGASRFSLLFMKFSQGVYYALFALLVSIPLIFIISNILQLNYLLPVFPVALIYVFLFLLFSGGINILGYLVKGNILNNNVKLKQNKVTSFFFILQFILALSTFSSVLFIKNQISFLNKMQLGSFDNNILVIKNNPTSEVLKYPVWKEKLLKLPGVQNITSAMEEPAGNVMDKVNYVLENSGNSTKENIYLFCTDTSFFSFFNIKALAGTIDLQGTMSIPQELKANYVWAYRTYGLGNITKDDIKEVDNYKDKYVINESALKQLGFNSPYDAIGKKLKLEHSIPELFPEGEIIGVVSDFHYTSLYEKEKPLVIVSRKIFSGNFLIRISNKNILKTIGSMKTIWKDVYNDIPFEYEFLKNHYENFYSSNYMLLRIMIVFSIISAIISFIGLTAIIIFMLLAKTKELGIRKVNGASEKEILIYLNNKFILLVGIATIIALPITILLINSWLTNFAYKADINGWVFVLTAFIGLSITILIVTTFSFKTVKKSPVFSLKYE